MGHQAGVAGLEPAPRDRATVGDPGGRAGGRLWALSQDNCHLAQGWGVGHPGYQVGGKQPCVYESVISPLALSVCKKCGEILLRSNCRDQRQEW